MHKARTLSRLVSTHCVSNGDPSVEQQLKIFRFNVGRLLRLIICSLYGFDWCVGNRVFAIAQRHSVRASEAVTVTEAAKFMTVECQSFAWFE